MAIMSAEVYSLRRAALAQLGGLAVVAVLSVGMAQLAHVDPTEAAIVLAMLQGGVAAMIAYRQNAPFWWLLIHLGFLPLAVVVRGLAIAPGWFLAGFILLLLVFWRTDRSRVPLYLSNQATAAALLNFLPKTPVRIIDLGCGDGGLLRRLAVARPDCQCIGIEHAPLPWLVARLRTLKLTNVSIHHGDFWREPLGSYGLIYAFLSPAPMPHLWEKARAEMAPGAWLVSNSFNIPDVAPVSVISVGDRRATRLYLYQSDKGRDSAAFPAIPLPANQE